ARHHVDSRARRRRDRRRPAAAAGPGQRPGTAVGAVPPGLGQTRGRRPRRRPRRGASRRHAAGHAVAARVPAVRGGPPHPAGGAGPVTAPLASAADLAGHDLGDGTVALEWTYPTDPAAAGVRFDVYAGSDPLAPLRSLALAR